MANQPPSLEDDARAAAALGTTQLLERAVMLLLFAGLLLGVLAALLLLLALAIVALPLIAVAPGLAERLVQGAYRLQAYLASAPQVPPVLAGLPVVGERLAGVWEAPMLL